MFSAEKVEVEHRPARADLLFDHVETCLAKSMLCSGVFYYGNVRIIAFMAVLQERPSEKRFQIDLSVSSACLRQEPVLQADEGFAVLIRLLHGWRLLCG